jgi:hypothetical protein
MSRKAHTVEDDVIEAVQEDDLESIIAELREVGEVEHEDEWRALASV